jgi:addiction module RelE/StbE family toxin
MDKYKIEITDPAENDLRSIGLYISKELLEPDTAKRVVSKIGDTIMKLEELPLRNELVSDERLSIKGIRRIIIDNYIVFYIANEDDRLVTIVRILYNRRDWINLI